jgi:hypothetical protein
MMFSIHNFCEQEHTINGKYRKFSMVSLCCVHMYFLRRHHLPPDKSENNQDSTSSDSDWFTYSIDKWLLKLFSVFNIWVSHALEMTIIFYYP